MNVGDLVKFKCIGAGKHDNPPYSRDGQWRTGMIVKITMDQKLFSGKMKYVHVFYCGEIVRALYENCQPAGKK